MCQLCVCIKRFILQRRENSCGFAENMTLLTSNTESMTHKAMVARKVITPCLLNSQWIPSHPCSVALGPYLVEVGGPVLSLLGLSFICVLFVCFVLHSHTALANLPNEPQELHNDNNGNKQTTHIRTAVSISRRQLFVLLGHHYWCLHCVHPAYSCSV